MPALHDIPPDTLAVVIIWGGALIYGVGALADLIITRLRKR